MPDSTPRPRHVALAVVFAVREQRLVVLLRRSGAVWALPGGPLARGETLERSLGLQLDVEQLAHLEQLETRSEPGRNRRERELATAYLGLTSSDVDLNGEWMDATPLPRLVHDHRAIVLAARARLRAKLSYTNIGFALAPRAFAISELRDVYAAALGHDVASTNLQRVLVRRGVLETTGEVRGPGRSGGRPAALFRFASRKLTITDEFAALRPPGSRASG